MAEHRLRCRVLSSFDKYLQGCSQNFTGETLVVDSLGTLPVQNHPHLCVYVLLNVVAIELDLPCVELQFLVGLSKLQVNSIAEVVRNNEADDVGNLGVCQVEDVDIWSCLVEFPQRFGCRISQRILIHAAGPRQDLLDDI